MLHYNNYTQGLNKLYFIQPEWLSDIFGKIITIPEVHNWWVTLDFSTLFVGIIFLSFAPLISHYTSLNFKLFERGGPLNIAEGRNKNIR